MSKASDRLFCIYPNTHLDTSISLDPGKNFYSVGAVSLFPKKGRVDEQMLSSFRSL